MLRSIVVLSALASGSAFADTVQCSTIHPQTVQCSFSYREGDEVLSVTRYVQAFEGSEERFALRNHEATGHVTRNQYGLVALKITHGSFFASSSYCAAAGVGSPLQLGRSDAAGGGYYSLECK